MQPIHTAAEGVSVWAVGTQFFLEMVDIFEDLVTFDVFCR